jgi:hypothetical protein
MRFGSLAPLSQRLLACVRLFDFRWTACVAAGLALSTYCDRSAAQDRLYHLTPSEVLGPEFEIGTDDVVDLCFHTHEVTSVVQDKTVYYLSPVQELMGTGLDIPLLMCRGEFVATLRSVRPQPPLVGNISASLDVLGNLVIDSRDDWVRSTVNPDNSCTDDDFHWGPPTTINEYSSTHVQVAYDVLNGTLQHDLQSSRNVTVDSPQGAFFIEHSTYGTVGSAVFDVTYEDAGTLCEAHSFSVQMLSSDGLPLWGVAADERTTTLVRITAETADPVLLELQTEDGSPAGQEFGALSVSNVLPAMTTPGHYSAEVAYVAPADLPKDSSKPVNLLIVATQGSSRSEQNLTLFYPPVLTVHGIWSSGAIWSGLRGKLMSSYPAAEIFEGDYQDLNFVSFKDPAIHERLLGAFGMARGQLLQEGILANRFDVVAHSMGGLAVASWSNDPGYASSSPSGRGWIRSMVTVATPVLGSPLANQLTDDGAAQLTPNPANGLYLVFSLISGTVAPTLGSVMAHMHMPLSCAGFAECAINSLRNVGGVPLAQTNIPVRGIRGIAPSESAVESILDTIMGQFFPAPHPTVDGLLGPMHDTIVPYGSQSAFGNPIVDDADVVHAKAGFVGVLSQVLHDASETESQAVYVSIECQLRAGPCSSAAIPRTVTAGAVISSYLDDLAAMDISGMVPVDPSNVSLAPPPGSDLLLAQQQTISFSGTPSFMPSVWYVWSDSTAIERANGTNASLSIFPEAIGDENIHAIAFDDSGRYLAGNYVYHVPAPQAQALALISDPAAIRMTAGGSVRLQFTAIYDGASTRLQAQAIGIAVSPVDTTTITVDNGLVLHALSAGHAQVTASYGSRTAVVDVIVSGGNIIFSNGFDRQGLVSGDTHNRAPVNP